MSEPAPRIFPRKTPWNKGKKFPADSYPNYGMRGKHHTEESNKKNSDAHKRGKNPNFGKHFTKTHRRNLSNAHTGKFHSYCSPGFKGHHHTETAKKKVSEAHKGKPHSYFSIGNTGQRHTEITKKKISVTTINAYKRGCYNRRPTILEKKFDAICVKYNLPFKYVGDGKFWVENMNPDFIEINGRKIAVEVLGDYWHNKTWFPDRDFEKRQKKFAEYGWRVIGIWEHELDGPEEEIVGKVMGT